MKKLEREKRFRMGKLNKLQMEMLKKSKELFKLVKWNKKDKRNELVLESIDDLNLYYEVKNWSEEIEKQFKKNMKWTQTTTLDNNTKTINKNYILGKKILLLPLLIVWKW